MRIYFRHIFNSIRLKPAQPFLIVLSIALAVAIFVSAYMVVDVFDRYNQMTASYAVGSADIRIEVRGGSQLRYMLTDEAEEIIGEDGKVVGMYKLSLFAKKSDTEKKSAAAVAAVDFEKLNDVYEFEPVAFGALTDVNVNESALISEEFAVANSLSIGDKVSLGVANMQAEYIVQGIYKTEGLMYDTNMLVSYESVLRKITTSLGIYMLAKDFIPCNFIVIDLDDNSKTQEYIDKLSAEERYADKLVTEAVSMGATDTITFVSTVLLYFMASVFACISVLLIYSGLTVISGNRSAENAQFRSVGATKRNMASLQLTECLVYSVIGGLLGLLLSLISSSLFSRALGIDGIKFSLNWDAALIGLAFGLVIPFLSHFVMLAKGANVSLDSMVKGESKLFKRAPVWIVVSVAVVVVLTVITFSFIPVSGYVIPFVIAFISIIVLVSLILPYITSGLTGLSDKLLDKSNTGGVIRVALKTAKVNLGLQNCQRILCVMAALVTLIVYALVYATAVGEDMAHIVKGEVAVLNVSDSNRALSQNITTAESYVSASIKRGSTMENGVSMMLVSADTYATEVLNLKEDVTIIPKDNEILLPSTVVRSQNKSVGDDVTLTIDGEKIVFRIAGTFECPLYFGIVDCNYIGTNLDMVLFKTKNGVAVDALYEEVSEAYGMQSVEIIYTEEITADLYILMERFMRLIKVLVILASLMGLLGCVNSYVEQYQNRKEEFKQLKSLGMTGKELFTVLAMEGSLNFSIAIALGIAVGWVLIGLSAAGMLSFGVAFLI